MKQTKKKKTTKAPRLTMGGAKKIYAALDQPIREICAEVAAKKLMAPAPTTTDEEVRAMSQLAEEVIGTQIAQLSTDIIDAANDSARAPSPPRMMWNLWDLAIAAWLNDAGQVSWVVKLGGAQTEAPSVVEALRGLLAIVKRFPRVTERAV